MSLFEALVLGIVQGVTEFLPVSSSAHLVLVPEFLGWQQPSLAYIVLLHAGSLVALLAYFRRELVQTVTQILQPGPARKFVVLLAAGTLPAAVIGFAFEDQFEAIFGNTFQVALQLVGTGLILLGIEILARRRPRPAEGTDDLTGLDSMVSQISPAKAAGVGFAQALAIFPGISRSGSTIAAGLLVGLSRAQAARFSFLLSISIVFGTTVLKVPELAGGEVGGGALVTGFFAALVSSYLAIAGLISFLQKRGLLIFAAYCMVAGTTAALIL